MLKEFLLDEEGQALSEYGLILGLIVIAVVVVLVALKSKIVAMFQKIVDALSV